MTISRLPREAAGLRLYRIAGDDLIPCELVMFDRGWGAVDTTLRRAQLSGRVEVGGKIENHFADVFDARGDMIETVALDSSSYRSLKTRWMRCKVDRELWK
jgi:hypothetical protein